MLYNQEDSRRALRDLIGTGMYENVQVLPEQTKKDERKVDVTVMVKERPMKTTEAGAVELGRVLLSCAILLHCFVSKYGVPGLGGWCVHSTPRSLFNHTLAHPVTSSATVRLSCF